MRIQHNISALNSYNKLSGNNNRLSKNLEKLSSGYAINRAADNAAGLAISEKMRAQITGLETCQQNSKDGISLVQTAEGALTEVHSMLNRMVALTTQASNGVYTETERTKIQDELDQLNDEIDRIADATNFNGIKLLDGNLTSGGTSGAGKAPAKSVVDTDLATRTYVDPVQGVYSAAGVITTTNFDEGASFKVSLNFDDGSVKDFDFEVFKNGNNLQLKLDGEALDYTELGLTATTNITAGDVEKVIVAKLNEDEAFAGKYEISAPGNKLSFVANEAGTSTPRVTGMVINGTKGDKATAINEVIGQAALAANGAVGTAGTSSSLATDASEKIKVDMTLYDGTNLEDAMFTVDGKKFVIAKSTTNVSGLSSDINVITSDITAAGATKAETQAIAQQMSQVLGREIGIAKYATGDANENALVFYEGAKKAGEGLRLQIGETNDSFNMLDVTIEDCHADAIGVGKTTMRVDNVDVANEAMMAAKDAVENVSKVRSRLGAIQNRLDHTLANLEETTTNLTEAESRIRDTDMAQEMMKYTKNNILIQSSQAMLAQANQVPQGVLQLLQ